MKYMHTAVTA